MKNIIKNIFAFSLIVAVSLLAVSGVCINVSALEDDGLTLSKSSVVSDDTDISRNVTVELDFNKNVCDLQYLKSNAESVHLLDKNNEPVPIKVTFPDTQVQTSYKRQIFITPKEPLAANEKYFIVIEDSLKSKDGTSLDKSYVLNFSTGESEKTEENAVLSYLKDNIMEFESNSPANPDALTTGENTTKESIAPKDDTSSLKPILIAAIVAVVIIVSFFIFKPSKKSSDGK